MLQTLLNFLENIIHRFVIFIVNYLPVKVIRDENGVPFLYRYHLFALTANGPGMCIHNFVKSDPDRGYHDHPWQNSMSFILSGYYDERILDLSDENKKSYTTTRRNRFHFNYLNGSNTFHRVMVEDGKDVWTLFAFGKRSKTWGMIGLDGKYKAMSEQVNDNDGGWWNYLGLGYSINNHIKHPGNVVIAVDIVIIANSHLLLIKRGKNPFKGYWAFPGGRIEQTDVDTISAAYRELKEETNIDNNIDLKYITTIGNNTRDPRGFCLTNVFMCKLDKIPHNVKAGDDAVDFKWFSLDELPKMAFDHKEILFEYILTR